MEREIKKNFQVLKDSFVLFNFGHCCVFLPMVGFFWYTENGMCQVLWFFNCLLTHKRKFILLQIGNICKNMEITSYEIKVFTLQIKVELNLKYTRARSYSYNGSLHQNYSGFLS